MAAGQIPWTAIMDYAARCGIDDPDDAEDFGDLITAMDTEYLKPKGRAEGVSP